MNQYKAVTYPASPVKGILILLGSVLFVAIGVWMLPHDAFMAWCGIIFFGFCALASLALLWPGASALTLDHKGFELAAMGRKTLTSWSDVASFEIVKMNHNRFIGITYAPTYAKYGKAHAMSRRMYGVDGILPSHFTISRDDLLAELQAWHRRATGN